MRCTTLAILPLLVSNTLTFALQARRGYEENTLSGWADRLSIPFEPIPNQPFEKDTGLSRTAIGGSPTLSVTKYALKKVYRWMIKEAQVVKDEYVEDSMVWKDTTPRFVVYGDEYSGNMSLSLPDPISLQGVTHFLVPFWTTRDGVTGSMLEWTQGTTAQRKAIVREYNKYGIRLGVSAFFTDTGKPNAVARRIAKFARKYQFQGVNVDYKDNDLFERSNATTWLVPLARRLRSELPNEEGYFLSHAPVAPLFNSNNYTESYSKLEERIGEAIDFYSVQMHGSEAYSTCRKLIHESGPPYSQSALLQLNKIWGIPLDKVVIGRPAGIHDAGDMTTHMKVDTFARCLGEAFSEGWKGGVSWRHLDGTSVESVLQPILDQVRHYPHHQKEAEGRHHIHAPKHRKARHAARAREEIRLL